MADSREKKGLILHHQGKFLHNYYTFVSVHDGNHDDVVRIFVGLSCELWGFFNYIRLHHITGHIFLYQERNYPMCACAARDRVIICSLPVVSQSLCGHKNEHFEWIRNACGFLLQRMSSKLKNNNIHASHTKIVWRTVKSEIFHSVQIIELNHTSISIFHTCYICS